MAKPVVVGIEAARATLKDLCAAAARGEEVVITRRGRPIARVVGERHEPLAVTYARVLRERDLDEVVAYRANGSPLTRAEMADLIDAGDAEALRYLDLFAASGVRAMGVKARREHEGKPKSS